jgi:hypothetical protein
MTVRIGFVRMMIFEKKSTHIIAALPSGNNDFQSHAGHSRYKATALQTALS